MTRKFNCAVFPLATLLATTGGTAVAQTELDPPLQMTQAEQTTVYRTIVREQAVPAATRQARRANRNVVRTTTTERIVTRPVVQERVVRNAPMVRERLVSTPVAGPMALTSTQSQVVYRSIVAQPTAPAVTERIVTAPRAASPVVTLDEPVAAPVVEERIVTAPTTGVGTVVEEAPLSSGVTLAVGARIPASVPIYPMPQTTIAQVPSMAAYRYAVVDDRVYLVDPNDGIVVGMLYQ
jgi:hypothetical protein